MPPSAPSSFGWDEDPPDRAGVSRARTKLGHFRGIWMVPSEAVRAIADRELGGGVNHPGLYILRNSESGRVYVGESSDLKTRLGNWSDKPPPRLGSFDRVYVLNDGRTSAHSIFTDETLRKALEQWIVASVKEHGKFETVNEVERPPHLAVHQKAMFDHLSSELGFLLHKLELVERVPPPKVDDSVTPIDQVGTCFPGRKFEKRSKYRGLVDGKEVIFTEGSDKPEGFQLTIRVNERWQKLLAAADGFVCWTRGPCYLVPISAIKGWLGDKLSKQPTVDVFLNLKREVLHTGGDLADLPVGTYRGSKDSNAFRAEVGAGRE